MKFRSVIAILLLSVLSASIGFAQDKDRLEITVDNANDLALERRLGRGSAEHVAWTSDGESILVGGSLGVWTYAADALDTESEPPLISTDGEVYDFALNPDGDVLTVSTSAVRGYTNFDPATGETLAIQELEDGTPQRLTYSPDGRYLAANLGSSGLVVIDVEANEVALLGTGSLDSDTPVVFTPDGESVFAATSSYDVVVWDVSGDGTPVTLDGEGHSGSVDALAVSPDGAWLVTGSTDDSFIVWDVAERTQVQQVAQPDDSFSNTDVYALAFSPDGAALLTGHGAAIRFWDTADWTMTSEIESSGRVIQLAYSPDGSQFVALTQNNAEAVQLFSAEGEQVAVSDYHNANINAVAFSPDSQVLAFNDNDSNLYLWSTGEAGEINTAEKIADGSSFGIDNKSHITFSSDGQYLATLVSFGAQLHNPVTGELLAEFEGDGIGVDIEFSPDNTMIAYAASRGFIVFDIEAREIVASFEHANDWIEDITWSPDQTMIAVAAADHAVRLYSVGE